MNFEWEEIEDLGRNHYDATFRAKVVGGWIVRHFHQLMDENNGIPSSSMVFVPDAGHTWEITDD